MTRLPIVAFSLSALAAPALAQVEQQPATESQEIRPTNQSSQFTADNLTEEHVEEDAAQVQPENAMGDGVWSQGGTGALAAGDGTQLGNVSISATASGHALVLINAEGFREGIYAIHLHEFGRCDGPDFESAGPHIGASSSEHGVYTDTGPHPGDLPNGHVGPDQQLMMEAFTIGGLTMDMIFDDDSSALVVHAQPDDYTTQPGGNSGERIACAVLEVAPGTVNDDTVDADQVETEGAVDQ